MADDKRRVVASLEGDTTEWSTISAVAKRDTGIFQEVTVELASGAVTTSPLGPEIADTPPETLGFEARTDADGTLIVWRDAGATQWRLPHTWHSPDAYPSGIDPADALTHAVLALREHGHEDIPPSAKPDCPLRCREAATAILMLERLSDHMKAAGEGVLGQIGGAIAVRDATLDAFFAGVLAAKVWARARERYAATGKAVHEGGAKSEGGRKVDRDAVRRAFNLHRQEHPAASRSQIIARTARAAGCSTRTVERHCLDLWQPRPRRTPEP